MNPIRVVIGDDHGVVRRGIRQILEDAPDIKVAGEASDGAEAVSLCATVKPDVCILDVAMPKLNGLQAAAQIVAANPKTGVIILSMYSDDEYITRALLAGAKGYLLKESADPDLVRAVQTVANGRPFFSRDISDTLLDDYIHRLRTEAPSEPFESLTAREKEVFYLLAQAKSSKDVAQALNLSLYTVETHRTNLMQKLDLHSAAELVLYAVKKKLIF